MIKKIKIIKIKGHQEADNIITYHILKILFYSERDRTYLYR